MGRRNGGEKENPKGAYQSGDFGRLLPGRKERREWELGSNGDPLGRWDGREEENLTGAYEKRCAFGRLFAGRKDRRERELRPDGETLGRGIRESTGVDDSSMGRNHNLV